MFGTRFGWNRPYRWRTSLREILPAFMMNFLPKGKDCEAAGASHDWYNMDKENSACYHCNVIEQGQLWKKN